MRDGRDEPGARGAELARGLAARCNGRQAGRAPKPSCPAATSPSRPGKVVYRNRLIELIQYAPATGEGAGRAGADRAGLDHEVLHPRPQRRTTRWCAGSSQQGFTVFMISWKNPGPEDRDLGMDDYRTLGVMAALDAISAIVPDRRIHAVGYCLGGTLLVDRRGRDGARRRRPARHRSRCLAAQTDFTEAGELTLFIDESQVAFLEDMMWEQGYLDTHADGRRVPDAALQRPGLVADRARLPDGRARADERPDGLERRRHAHALPHALASTCAGCSWTTTWPKGASRSAGRPDRADATSACRSSRWAPMQDHVAPWRSRLQDPPADRHRRHLRADQRRPQRRHRHRAGPPAPRAIGCSTQARRRPLPGSRRLARPLPRTARAPGGPNGWRWLDAALGRAGAAARDGCTREAGYRVLCDAPGTYVMQA